jgi:hypothetical protein
MCAELALMRFFHSAHVIGLDVDLLHTYVLATHLTVLQISH